MAKTMVVAISVVASLQSALFVCPPSLPISPSPVFGHLVVIIKILNVAMIKAFKEKMPTPSFCYEAMKSKSHIVSENRKCNTDPFVFPPIGPNNSHLTVAA